MQDNAAVYRTQETLFEGKGLIDETVKSFKDVKVREDYLFFRFAIPFSLLRCCCNDEVTNHSLTITIPSLTYFLHPFLDVIQTTDRSLIWNTDLVETLELRNLLGNASATMHAAEVSIIVHSNQRPLALHYIASSVVVAVLITL